MEHLGERHPKPELKQDARYMQVKDRKPFESIEPVRDQVRYELLAKTC